ncbi:MAG: HTH domain-containing protein [Clostridiales bacterium]|nr:HTH domain-containing protein [Clostridiales bacterium]
MTSDALAKTIGLTSRAIEKNIRQLKEAGVIDRRGGDRGGYWVIK